VSAARLPRALAAEAIGTYVLVFPGAGAVMVDAKAHALGHVSGAHFNGAVTFAFALTRRFQFVRGEATRPAGLAVADTEEAT
jgi:aquaporin NIP